MLYSPEDKLLFCHISRTGGVSVASSLRDASSDMSSILSQHASLSEAREELGDAFESAFKFSIVRNPWERLVSWYAHIAASRCPKPLNRKVVSDPESAHWREFDDFLEEWLNRKITIDGARVPEMSQSAQLSDGAGRLLTDAIGRFETLSLDLSEILHRAGFSPVPLLHLNRSLHLPYREYFSEHGRELVADVLKTDIERFGYQFDESEAPGRCQGVND